MTRDRATPKRRSGDSKALHLDVSESAKLRYVLAEYNNTYLPLSIYYFYFKQTLFNIMNIAIVLKQFIAISIVLV